MRIRRTAKTISKFSRLYKSEKLNKNYSTSEKHQRKRPSGFG